MEGHHVSFVEGITFHLKAGRYDGFSSKEADLYLRMNSVGRNKNNETENFEEDSQQTQEPENKENYTPDVK